MFYFFHSVSFCCVSSSLAPDGWIDHYPTPGFFSFSLSLSLSLSVCSYSVGMVDQAIALGQKRRVNREGIGFGLEGTNLIPEAGPTRELGLLKTQSPKGKESLVKR